MAKAESRRPPGLDTYSLVSTEISWFGVPKSGGGGAHHFICPGCGDEWTSYWEYADHICQTTELPRGNHAPAESPSKQDLVKRIARLLDLDDGLHYTNTGAGPSLTAEGLEEILSNLKWRMAHIQRDD